jgi:hypothetical protein
VDWEKDLEYVAKLRGSGYVVLEVISHPDNPITDAVELIFAAAITPETADHFEDLAFQAALKHYRYRKAQYDRATQDNG